MLYKSVSICEELKFKDKSNTTQYRSYKPMWCDGYSPEIYFHNSSVKSSLTPCLVQVYYTMLFMIIEYEKIATATAIIIVVATPALLCSSV